MNFLENPSPLLSIIQIGVIQRARPTIIAIAMASKPLNSSPIPNHTIPNVDQETAGII
jgi:hypothetical protein